MPPTTDDVSALEGPPFELSELLAYQEGAVVSRTLIDRESATVTLFAFDAGQRLSEHTAPHVALLQVLDGTATVSVAGDASKVTAGESIVLPADIPHAVDATERFKMLLTMVR